MSFLTSKLRNPKQEKYYPDRERPFLSICDTRTARRCGKTENGKTGSDVKIGTGEVGDFMSCGRVMWPRDSTVDETRWEGVCGFQFKLLYPKLGSFLSRG